MGTIIEFPADASRRLGSSMAARGEGLATVVILPVIRIERHVDIVDNGGPEDAATPGRRRRRRARS